MAQTGARHPSSHYPRSSSASWPHSSSPIDTHIRSGAHRCLCPRRALWAVIWRRGVEVQRPRMVRLPGETRRDNGHLRSAAQGRAPWLRVELLEIGSGRCESRARNDEVAPSNIGLSPEAFAVILLICRPGALPADPLPVLPLAIPAVVAGTLVGILLWDKSTTPNSAIPSCRCCDRG